MRIGSSSADSSRSAVTDVRDVLTGGGMRTTNSSPPIRAPNSADPAHFRAGGPRPRRGPCPRHGGRSGNFQRRPLGIPYGHRRGEIVEHPTEPAVPATAALPLLPRFGMWVIEATQITQRGLVPLPECTQEFGEPTSRPGAGNTRRVDATSARTPGEPAHQSTAPRQAPDRPATAPREARAFSQVPASLSSTSLIPLSPRDRAARRPPHSETTL